MKYERRRNVEPSHSSNSVQLLALSMFIMLLAFFIVLNAISSFEENRTEPILGSLEKTFSTSTSRIPQRRPSARPSDTLQEFKGEGDTTTLDRIRDLFQGRIARVTIRENKETGVMMVEVPYAEFSTAILALGQSADQVDLDELPFLPTLVSLIQTSKDEKQYQMTMLLKTDTQPVDLKIDRPEEFRSMRDKIGKLSQRLGDAGISDEFMAIGLRQGEENMLDLIFKPYESREPVIATPSVQEVIENER